MGVRLITYFMPLLGRSRAESLGVAQSHWTMRSCFRQSWFAFALLCPAEAAPVWSSHISPASLLVVSPQVRAITSKGICGEAPFHRARSLYTSGAGMAKYR